MVLVLRSGTFAVLLPAVPIQAQPPPPTIHDTTPSALSDSPYPALILFKTDACVLASAGPPCNRRQDSVHGCTARASRPTWRCMSWAGWLQGCADWRVSLQWLRPPSCTRTLCSRCKAQAPMMRLCTAHQCLLPGAS